MLTLLNSLFLVAFVLSAMVQYNDPDPLRWMAIYLAAAVMCGLAHKRRLRRYAPLSLMIISLLWISQLWPGIAGKISLAELLESISMKTQTVEEAREIGGLALVLIWSAVLSVIGPKRVQHPDNEPAPTPE